MYVVFLNLERIGKQSFYVLLYVMSNHNKFNFLKRSNTNKRMLVFITCIELVMENIIIPLM